VQFLCPTTTRSIPLAGESPQYYQHVGVVLVKDSSLMGTFSPPPHDIPNLVAFINMISSCTTPSNPWMVPNTSNVDTFSDRMSLSPVEIGYEAIYSACLAHFAFPSSIYLVDYSQYYGSYFDHFSDTFSTNESIMEIMISNDASWNNNHHCSSLPKASNDSLGDIYSP